MRRIISDAITLDGSATHADGVLQFIECQNSHNNLEEDGRTAPHIETAPDYTHTLHERAGRANLEMNIPDSVGLELTPGTNLAVVKMRQILSRSGSK